MPCCMVLLPFEWHYEEDINIVGKHNDEFYPKTKMVSLVLIESKEPCRLSGILILALIIIDYYLGIEVYT